MEGNKANVVASDGGRVVISLKQTAVDTQFVEFEGMVEAPNQLRETDRAYFGGSFGNSCSIYHAASTLNQDQGSFNLPLVLHSVI